jgi:hypothetical protein
MEAWEKAHFQYLEKQAEIALAEMREKFSKTPPLTESGMPTSGLAYYIIDALFDSRNKDVDLEYISKIRCLKKDLLEIMFRQLEEMDLVIETSPGKFRYNLNCEDYEFQCKVEKWLLDFYDVKGDGTIPIYMRIPYYPGDEPPKIPFLS